MFPHRRKNGALDVPSVSATEDYLITAHGHSHSPHLVIGGGDAADVGIFGWRVGCSAAFNHMECRIDVAHQAGSSVVRIAGRLTDAQVPDLLKVCAKPELVRLDLAELDSASGVAVEALRRLQKAGAQIVGAPPFIQLLIEVSPFSGE